MGEGVRQVSPTRGPAGREWTRAQRGSCIVHMGAQIVFSVSHVQFRILSNLKNVTYGLAGNCGSQYNFQQ